ncbi:nitroreductase [Pediococcus argentinicus]|uniref:p-nitrobenzoate reductase n=1 Tax=Pediococcus argentinicus TaxID=480391 RepID=A0A0R2NLJ3_9LACO|nr:nitroreductase [Pediococcus argentinicus]KRO24909.1 P-nitrobenzoate reductase [Pediococcus argentinicus]NKZ22608.1 nitroreductase [Pediococcus argentinicus]GEP19733.1 nitrobenzoate reductase [Pediococcus argentinicus]
MDTIETIHQRHATRAFKDDTISNELLKSIIADAQTAPSWGNSQPWKVTIATGESLSTIKNNFNEASKNNLMEDADLSKAHRGDFSSFASQNMGDWVGTFHPIITADSDTYWDSRRSLYHAPAIAYLTIGKNPNSWSIYDLGAFSQTLMLSATARGVQSLVSYELIKYPDIIRDALKIPSDQIIAIGVALGYEKTDKVLNQFRSHRINVDDILNIVD